MSDENTSKNLEIPNPGYAHDASSPIMDGTRNVRIGDVEVQNLNQWNKDPDIKQFISGARSSGQIPPYECLTLNFLRRAAMRMKLGMHYGKHNWKKGIADKQFILDRLNHAMEHLVKAQAQIDNGMIMTDDDLAAVVVNCMFAMEYQDSPNTPPQHIPGDITSAQARRTPMPKHNQD